MKIIGIALEIQDDRTIAVVKAAIDKGEVLEAEDLDRLLGQLREAAGVGPVSRDTSPPVHTVEPGEPQPPAAQAGGRRRSSVSPHAGTDAVPADVKTDTDTVQGAPPTRRRQSGGGTQSTTSTTTSPSDAPAPTTRRRNTAGASAAAPATGSSASTQPSSTGASDTPSGQTNVAPRRRSAAAQTTPEVDDTFGISDEELGKAVSQAAAALEDGPNVVLSILREDYGANKVNDLKGKARRRFIEHLLYEQGGPEPVTTLD